MRKQLDRTIQAEKQIHQQKITQALDSLKRITAALSKAIYNQQLITEIDSFLKKYAPDQAALKKQMEEAQKKRSEEQKRRESMRPSETPGRYEQNVSYGRPSYDYGYHSDFPNFTQSDWNKHSPEFSYGLGDHKKNEKEKLHEESKKPAEKASEKTKDQKSKEEKKEESKEEKEKKEKAKEKEKPSDEIKAVNKLLEAIEKDINTFDLAYQQQTNKNILREFENYTKEATIKQKKTRQKYEEVTEWVPAPVNNNMSTNLQNVEKALKIDALAKSFEDLYKTIRKIKVGPDQEKSWKKIASALKKQQKKLQDIAEKLMQCQENLLNEDMPSAKKNAHFKDVEKFTSNIISIVANFNKINDRYFAEEELKEISPTASLKQKKSKNFEVSEKETQEEEIEQKSFEQLVSNIDKDLKTFSSQFNRPENQTIIDNLENQSLKNLQTLEKSLKLGSLSQTVTTLFASLSIEGAVLSPQQKSLWKESYETYKAQQDDWTTLKDAFTDTSINLNSKVMPEEQKKELERVIENIIETITQTTTTIKKINKKIKTE